MIAARLGAEHAAKLAKLAGGTRIVVPEQTAGNARVERAFARLSRRFGRKLALLLVLHLGPRTLYVPNGKRLHTIGPEGIEMISTLTQRGWTLRRIALRVGCSERTVAHYRNRSKRS